MDSHHAARVALFTRVLQVDIVCCSSGANRDRTGGLLVANQALSQLSYSPEPAEDCFCPRLRGQRQARVGLSGIEPLTSRLSGVRSNQTEL